MENVEPDKKKTDGKKWLKRIGFAGFLFFLVKGIAWIVVALLAWKGCDYTSDQSLPKKSNTVTKSK